MTERIDIQSMVAAALDPHAKGRWWIERAMRVCRQRSERQRLSRQTRNIYAACRVLMAQHIYSNHGPEEVEAARAIIFSRPAKKVA